MGVTRQNSTKKGIKEIMNFAIFLDFSRLKLIWRKFFAQIGSNFNNKDIDTIVLFFPGSLVSFVVTLSLVPGICRQIFGRYVHGKTVTVRITYLSRIEKKKCWFHGPIRDILVVLSFKSQWFSPCYETMTYFKCKYNT